jgi:hypothetical protein
MCVHEIAAAAIADAMSVIYDVTEMAPDSMIAVRLTNTLYMETLIALQEMDAGDEEDEVWPTDYNPEAN